MEKKTRITCITENSKWKNKCKKRSNENKNNWRRWKQRKDDWTSRTKIKCCHKMFYDIHSFIVYLTELIFRTDSLIFFPCVAGFFFRCAPVQSLLVFFLYSLGSVRLRYDMWIKCLQFIFFDALDVKCCWCSIVCVLFFRFDSLSSLVAEQRVHVSTMEKNHCHCSHLFGRKIRLVWILCGNARLRIVHSLRIMHLCNAN